METKTKILISAGVIIIGISIFFYKKQQYIQNQKKGKELVESYRLDCETGEWSEWSPCNVSCGGGTQSRTRVMKKPAKDGGSCILNDTKRCNMHLCPIDCKVSDWSQFSCQNVNGIWKKTRTRTVREYPAYGGKECPSLTEEEVCPPVNCQISDWSEYGPCTYYANDRVFKKTRAKTITQAPLYGGTVCPSDLTQSIVCPFIVADSVVPSTSGAWNRDTTIEKAYDNNYETSWVPGERYNGLTGQWLLFKYNNSVNIEGIYMNFLLSNYEASNSLLTVKIYKNVEQSETSPIKINGDLSNYIFPSNSLVLEKTYTEYRDIILNEKLNITNINNIMVMFSKDTSVKEIQFY